jgi:O-antigen/teichoic acid export membrane protein
VVGNLIMGLIQRQTGRWIVTKRLAGDGVRSPGTFRFELLKTMWPNAWRIAMVSTGAFLILQSSTLICSGFLDLKTTASYGLTMQVVTMVYSLSTIWVVVKFPLINQWRAQHRSQEISALFISRLRLSLITYLLGALGIFFVVPRLLAILHSKTQLIPAGPLMLLLTSQLLDFHHNLYGGLIYTENRNPLVRPVLISGIVIAGLSCILTPRLGLYGIVLSIMLVQASFNNWWVVLRGIAGLQIEPRLYWKQFFGLKPL